MSRKKALIIGNNTYIINSLKIYVNDANALAKELREFQFEVDLKHNLVSKDMYNCVTAFIKSIQPGDFIICFYAGHGVEWMVDELAKQNPYV